LNFWIYYYWIIIHSFFLIVCAMCVAVSFDDMGFAWLGFILGGLLYIASVYIVCIIWLVIVGSEIMRGDQLWVGLSGLMMLCGGIPLLTTVMTVALRVTLMLSVKEMAHAGLLMLSVLIVVLTVIEVAVSG
jgi:hypothetical protein